MAISESSGDAAKPAVFGTNTAGGDAVFGQAAPTGRGVVGVSESHTAVEGNTRNGMAIYGLAAAGGRGVVGGSDTATAVEGGSKSGVGVWGASETNEGMHAETKSPVTAAIAAFSRNPTGTGAAV